MKNLLKKIALTLTLLISINTMPAFASTNYLANINSKGTLADIQKTIKHLQEKYDIEFVYNINEINKNTDNIYKNISSLKELEKLLPTLIEEASKPIELEEQFVYLNNKARATTGTATLYVYTEPASGLKIKHSFTGNYRVTNGTTYWNSMNGSSISQYSTTGYSKLGEIQKKTTTLSSDRTYCTMNFEYEVNHYVVVPVPVLNKVGVKIGTSPVKGKINFSANKI